MADRILTPKEAVAAFDREKQAMRDVAIEGRVRVGVHPEKAAAMVDAIIDVTRACLANGSVSARLIGGFLALDGADYLSFRARLNAERGSRLLAEMRASKRGE